ncbi:MAG: hypothetical protein ABH878_05805 [bacterium]
MKKRQFECKDCGHTWEEPFGTGRPGNCPACQSKNIYRTDSGPRSLGQCGKGPQGGRGQGQGGGRLSTPKSTKGNGQ